MRFLAVMVLCLAPGASQQVDAFEREWSVRSQALDPHAHKTEIAALLQRDQAAEWLQRVVAFDALTRAARVGTELPAGILEALAAWETRGYEERHPNEIASFLRLFVAIGRAPGVRGMAAANLAAHPFPAVREQVALLAAYGLETRAVATWRSTLQSLLADRDERVRVAARMSFLRLAALAPDPAWFAEVWDAGRYTDPDSAREFLVDEFVRAERASVDLTSLRAWRDRRRAESEEVWQVGSAEDWLCALLELRLGALASLDTEEQEALLERVVEGWPLLFETPGTRSFAERAASRGGLLLGDRFLEAVAGADREYHRAATGNTEVARKSQEEAEAWLAAAVLALDGTTLVEHSRELETPRRVALLQLLSMAERVIEPGALAPDIGPDQDVTLRSEVQDLLSRRAVVYGDLEATDLLARYLDDPVTELAEGAFRALVHAPVGEVAEPLAFEAAVAVYLARLPNRELRAALSHIPRRRAWPTLDDVLIDLAERDPASRAAAAELLRARNTEPRVSGALVGFLDEACDDWAPSGRAELGEDERLDLFVRAERLARALHGVAAAAPVLERTALVFGPDSEDIGKHALGALATSATGRSRLAPFLDAERFASRLVIEAALGMHAALELSATERDEALSILFERYENCDSELGQRIIDACALHDDERSWAFLEALIDDARGASHVRLAALTALAERPSSQPSGRDRERLLRRMREVLTREPASQLARGVLQLLALGEDARATHTLLALARFCEGNAEPGEAFPELARAQPAELKDLREAVWMALAHCALADPIVEELLPVVWGHVLATSAEDLGARFTGLDLPKAEFRWRGELGLASRLFRSATSLTDQFTEPEALARELSVRVGDWWRADGQFLLRLAQVTEGELAGLFARAAAVALDGEAPGRERDELRLAADLELISACEDLGDWNRFALVCDRLARDWRADRLPRDSFFRAFGRYDAVAEIDPLARLESGALQARALAALVAGDSERARGYATRAARRARGSRTALEAQRVLEARLR